MTWELFPPEPLPPAPAIVSAPSVQDRALLAITRTDSDAGLFKRVFRWGRIVTFGYLFMAFFAWRAGLPWAEEAKHAAWVVVIMMGIHGGQRCLRAYRREHLDPLSPLRIERGAVGAGATSAAVRVYTTVG